MLLFDPEDPEEFKTCKKVAERMAQLAVQLGGEREFPGDKSLISDLEEPALASME